MSTADGKIKVLHIVGAMYPGGMENFIMNIYENIDRERFCFDFAVHDIKENGYEDRIRELGGEVYLLPRFSRQPLNNLSRLKEIIKTGQYDVVIRHTANALVAPQLFVAKKLHVKTICHSHNETDPKQVIHRLFRPVLNSVTDIRLACSQNAGKWMYGNKDFRVINNAIDLNRFEYKVSYREKVISEFNLEGCHIYGHIANFIESKNHSFLLDVFKEISDRDDKAVLICLGEGELRPEIERQIKEKRLENKVVLTGIRHDPEAFMSAFDIMIFPSIFEGLPLTLVEAQASGLPILMSDTITPNVIITEGLVNTASLSDNATTWADKAIKLSKSNVSSNRVCQREKIREHGYDLTQLVEWYESFLTGISVR